MTAELASQKAIRRRLVEASAVTALVPEMAILDVNHRPAPRPSIVIGEADARIEGVDVNRVRETVTHTLHVWTQERSTENCKTIVGMVKAVINAHRLTADDWHVIDSRARFTRIMRDPDGESAHGILTVELSMRPAPGIPADIVVIPTQPGGDGLDLSGLPPLP